MSPLAMQQLWSCLQAKYEPGVPGAVKDAKPEDGSLPAKMKSRCDAETAAALLNQSCGRAACNHTCKSLREAGLGVLARSQQFFGHLRLTMHGCKAGDHATHCQ